MSHQTRDAARRPLHTAARCPEPARHAPLRLAILQRVCTSYRLALFRRLSEMSELRVRLFIGDDVPNSKLRGAADLDGVDAVRLPTRFIRLPGRVLPVHRGLDRALEDFQPDVILTEGESHPLGSLAAIRYGRRHGDVGLAHWSLGGLPGVSIRPGRLRSRVKRGIQSRFDVLLTYSSFGKECLVGLGHPAEKILVATNVSNTEEHLQRAEAMSQSPSEARAQLGLPDRFTAIYAGAMDPNKRLDVLLDAVARMGSASCNAVLLGRGGMIEQLKAYARQRRLGNVFFPGHVGEELALYFRASDVLVLPGRGGMVISEAMAHALPVVIFQADGTEYDLVRDGETGVVLRRGDSDELSRALQRLAGHPEMSRRWGELGQQLVRDRFNMATLARQIVEAVQTASLRARQRRHLQSQRG